MLELLIALVFDAGTGVVVSKKIRVMYKLQMTRIQARKAARTRGMVVWSSFHFVSDSI
jgi:hypothetical protein